MLHRILPMSHARRAEEIMHPGVATVAPEATVWEMARLFVTKGIGGAPVVDEHGQLLGVVSKTDLVRHFREMDGVARGDFYADPEPDHAKTPSHEAKARDLMSVDVISAPAEASVEELSRLMLKNRVHRVLITRGRKVLGIVTATDLLKVL